MRQANWWCLLHNHSRASIPPAGIETVFLRNSGTLQDRGSHLVRPVRRQRTARRKWSLSMAGSFGPATKYHRQSGKGGCRGTSSSELRLRQKRSRCEALISPPQRKARSKEYCLPIRGMPSLPSRLGQEPQLSRHSADKSIRRLRISSISDTFLVNEFGRKSH